MEATDLAPLRPALPLTPGGRRPELQDPLNRRLYHPLAARLARPLAAAGVSPNAISVAGMMLVWAAATAYAALPWPAGALLGLALHMAWHVADGADGDVARLTGKSSPRGEMIDGLCDYGAHAVLYVVLALILDGQLGVWAWVLGIAAAASHAVQTNHAEVQRRSYSWWAYGVPWIKHAQAAGDAVFRPRNLFARGTAALTRTYLWVALRMAPWAAQLDRLFEEAAADPQRTERMRGTVRAAWKTALSLEKAVGPNPRTLILGAAMLAGSPQWFFLAEIVVLNAVLVVSVAYHNALGRRLVAELAAA